LIYYVDTSAFLAILDADDKSHVSGKRQWTELVLAEATLVCSDYVLIESLALIQHRLGLTAARVFHEDIFPLLNIQWIDELTYRAGMASVLTAARRDLSLVDCISFEVMRRLGIQSAFTFDKHFHEQGFICVP
jgi:predicted nucleic acid-binding protein